MRMTWKLTLHQKGWNFKERAYRARFTKIIWQPKAFSHKKLLDLLTVLWTSWIFLFLLFFWVFWQLACDVCMMYLWRILWHTYLQTWFTHICCVLFIVNCTKSTTKPNACRGCHSCFCVFMSNKRGKFYQTKCVIGMDGWLKSLFCPKTLDS